MFRHPPEERWQLPQGLVGSPRLPPGRAFFNKEGGTMEKLLSVREAADAPDVTPSITGRWCLHGLLQQRRFSTRKSIDREKPLKIRSAKRHRLWGGFGARRPARCGEGPIRRTISPRPVEYRLSELEAPRDGQPLPASQQRQRSHQRLFRGAPLRSLQQQLYPVNADEKQVRVDPDHAVTREEAIERIMARRNCCREQAVELIKRLEDEYPEKEFSKGN